MKLLTAKAATPEQLRIIAERRPGTDIVRGAAGSGKTTTALLRLKNLTDMFRAKHVRLGISRSVNVLMLTYNRTLSGYVEALAREQSTGSASVHVQVDTFARWALSHLGAMTLNDSRNGQIIRIASKYPISLSPEFLCAEVEYVLGRFPSISRNQYIDIERTGRGTSPRVERNTRTHILKIIEEYKAGMSGSLDWDDLPDLMSTRPGLQYDIVIVDEAQDFSANQLRAVLHHLAPDGALTLVIDTVQRLYPRGYTWAEAGLDMRRVRTHRLQRNHRNTVEIATFARAIIDGVSIDDDGTLPDLTGATRRGSLPLVVKGKFSAQLDYTLDHIISNIDLSQDNVSFLHPKGGGWFDAIRKGLRRKGLGFVELTRERDWPTGPENIALSTMHSAKGLEFDHVVILGLNAEVTPHGSDPQDHDLDTLRRLLAMAVARARSSVLIGYKPEDASHLVDYFRTGTFMEVSL